jgi:hypothetical protein
MNKIMSLWVIVLVMLCGCLNGSDVRINYKTYVENDHNKFSEGRVGWMKDSTIGLVKEEMGIMRVYCSRGLC